MSLFIQILKLSQIWRCIYFSREPKYIPVLRFSCLDQCFQNWVKVPTASEFSVVSCYTYGFLALISGYRVRSLVVLCETSEALNGAPIYVECRTRLAFVYMLLHLKMTRRIFTLGWLYLWSSHIKPGCAVHPTFIMGPKVIFHSRVRAAETEVSSEIC